MESRQMSLERNQRETWELWSVGIGWGLLPPPKGSGTSTWLLMSEGQWVVVPSAGLSYAVFVAGG